MPKVRILLIFSRVSAFNSAARAEFRHNFAPPGHIKTRTGPIVVGNGLARSRKKVPNFVRPLNRVVHYAEGGRISKK